MQRKSVCLLALFAAIFCLINSSAAENQEDISDLPSSYEPTSSDETEATEQINTISFPDNDNSEKNVRSKKKLVGWIFNTVFAVFDDFAFAKKVLMGAYEHDVHLMRTNPEAWRDKHFGEDGRLMRNNPEAWREKHFGIKPGNDEFTLAKNVLMVEYEDDAHLMHTNQKAWLDKNCDEDCRLMFNNQKAWLDKHCDEDCKLMFTNQEEWIKKKFPENAERYSSGKNWKENQKESSVNNRKESSVTKLPDSSTTKNEKGSQKERSVDESRESDLSTFWIVFIVCSVSILVVFIIISIIISIASSGGRRHYDQGFVYDQQYCGSAYGSERREIGFVQTY